MINLVTVTASKKKIQHNIAIAVSCIFGGINTINPCSLIRAEKLETQNGMRYSLNVCQRSLLLVLEVTLNTRAVPITALMPIELIHTLGEISK